MPVEIKTSVTRKGIESGRRSRNLPVASSKTRSEPEGMWTYREGTVGSPMRKCGEDVTVMQINSWGKFGARRSVEDRRLCEAKALGSNPSESIFGV